MVNKKLFGSRFINNALFTLDNIKNLKAHNLKNMKIFWKSDLNEYLDKDEKSLKLLIMKTELLYFLITGLF